MRGTLFSENIPCQEFSMQPIQNRKRLQAPYPVNSAALLLSAARWVPKQTLRGWGFLRTHRSITLVRDEVLQLSHDAATGYDEDS